MEDDRSEQGLAIRKQVLGEQYVANAAATADPFTAPLQDFLNANCWGLVWTRGGLDLKTRSVITLTVLAVTGKTTELQAHVRGALRNGLTPDEIREIFFHICVYAGVPTAVEAFRAAQPAIADGKGGSAHGTAAHEDGSHATR